MAIVGAGAAGLMTAIHARSTGQRPMSLLLDGARTPGAKILVSGGSRCNVTNTIVTERDFWGGRSTIIRRILRAFPVSETVSFFEANGVALQEEEGGKLFPTRIDRATCSTRCCDARRRRGGRAAFRHPRERRRAPRRWFRARHLARAT